MAFTPQYYNDVFKVSYPPITLPDARYDVQYTPNTAAGLVFRCIGVHHLLPTENNGNHNVYLDVLDQNGQRIMYAEIVWGWEGMRPEEQPRPAIVDKPSNEAGTNISLVWGQKAYVSVKTPTYPSDKVANLHIQHPDESAPGGNTLGHHSFYVVFMLRDDGIIIEPPPADKTVSVAAMPSGRIEYLIDGTTGLIKETRYKA